MLTIIQSIEHGRQCEEDAIGWVRDVKKISDPALLEAYRAGFRKGWGDCQCNSRLHGGIETERAERKRIHGR